MSFEFFLAQFLLITPRSFPFIVVTMGIPDSHQWDHRPTIHCLELNNLGDGVSVLGLETIISGRPQVPRVLFIGVELIVEISFFLGLWANNFSLFSTYT